MKVLILSTMYPNSKMYLSGIFVHEQVRALTKIGVDVKVIAPVPYSPFPLNHLSDKWSKYFKIPDYENIDGINVYHTRYIAIPKGILRDYWHHLYLLSIKKLLNKSDQLRDINLIHCQGTLPNDFAAYILSRKLNIPFVLTIHGETVYELFHQPRIFNKSKIAVENANAVVAVSSQVVKRITKFTNRTKDIYKVLNGYTNSHHILSASSDSENIKILFAASLIERKGCDYLLRAYSRLIKKFHNIRLVIAGGGELLQELTNLASELGIENRVNFTDTISHTEMLQQMSVCDIFILPSYNEAFGVVYLEAMSFKKPVIGTEGEGIADIIKEGRFDFYLTLPKEELIHLLIKK